MNPETGGPYRIDDVIAIWRRISRTLDVLRGIGVVRSSLEQLRARLAVEAGRHGGAVNDRELTTILRVLAAQDLMTSSDWLRMKAVESRRLDRPGHQLDLRGLRCRRLVVSFTPDGEVCVTVQNRKGHIASVQSCNFGNALDGAIRMAGARSEQT